MKRHRKSRKLRIPEDQPQATLRPFRIGQTGPGLPPPKDDYIKGYGGYLFRQALRSAQETPSKSEEKGEV